MDFVQHIEDQVVNRGKNELVEYFEGFRVKTTESNDFVTSVGSFAIKKDKIYLSGDRVQFKFFGSNLVSFIETKNKEGKINRWYLKGSARTMAYTMFARLKYAEAKVITYAGNTYVFEYNKRYLVEHNGKIVSITKSKKESAKVYSKYTSYDYKQIQRQKPRVYLGDVETIYDGVEDFQSREEELKEALNTILSMRGRDLLFEERELLKEIESEIEFLVWFSFFLFCVF